MAYGRSCLTHFKSVITKVTWDTILKVAVSGDDLDQDCSAKLSRSIWAHSSAEKVGIIAGT